MQTELRKRPPPLREMIADAIRHGADTSMRLADLFGITVTMASREILELERQGRVKRGPVYRYGVGRPARRWRFVSRKHTAVWQ